MGISKSIFRVCAALSMAAFAAGCASQTNGISAQAAIQGAVNAIGASLGGQPAGAAASSAPIGVPSESSFKDILVSQSSSQWPRVAVTITALQPTGYNSSVMTWDNTIPGNACMRLSAVVWSDAKTSKAIPEETFCASQMRRNVTINSNGVIQAWGMFEDLVHKTPNTGHARTNGPTPPAKLFPEGADYKNFFDSSKASKVFGVLARLMGYDFSVDGVKDRRLWVVSIPTEGEIIGGQKVLR